MATSTPPLGPNSQHRPVDLSFFYQVSPGELFAKFLPACHSWTRNTLLNFPTLCLRHVVAAGPDCHAKMVCFGDWDTF